MSQTQEATGLVRRYVRLDREGSKVLKQLRDFFLETLHLYCELCVFQQTGGRAGDLAAETMEYEVYMYGSEGGHTKGAIYLYSVVDDSCNGYGHCLSVILCLNDEADMADKVLQFLDGFEFVSSHKSFRDRPFSCHYFRAYLDAVPRDNLLTAFCKPGS